MLTGDHIIAIYHAGPKAGIDLGIPLGQTLEHQQLEITALKARLTALENQRAPTSRKPPASDGFAQQTRWLRPPFGKPSGGQPGHPGTTLKPGAMPDRMIRHAPERCLTCGRALRAVPGCLAEERRQVFEVPVWKLVVIEHSGVIKECPGCGQHNTGACPEEVAPGARSGAGVKRLLTSVPQEHRVPSARSWQLCEDWFGQPLAEGTRPAAGSVCAAELGDTAARLKPGLLPAEVVNCAATGREVAAQGRGLQSASTPQLTQYACHENRGSAAPPAMGLLPQFKGRALHAACRSDWH